MPPYGVDALWKNILSATLMMSVAGLPFTSQFFLLQVPSVELLATQTKYQSQLPHWSQSTMGLQESPSLRLSGHVPFDPLGGLVGGAWVVALVFGVVGALVGALVASVVASDVGSSGPSVVVS